MIHINYTVPLLAGRVLLQASILAMLLLAGCATPPEKETEIPGEIFYPPLPDAPRIQYLATFSSSKDVSKPDTDFAKFVLGKDKDKDAVYIRKPYGVQMYDGKIYVVDTRGGGYAVMDLVNQNFRMITGDGGGRMSKPINITFDSDGSKYITDTQRNQVLVFDKNERFVRALGKEKQFQPSDTAISGDKLFVADVRDHEIEVLNKHSGVLLYKIGRAGSKDGAIFHPTNIKIGPDNHLYVSETTNFRVQKFTLDGRHLRYYGSIGTGLGKFARPKGIALDKAGRLYVVDAAFENIQIINPDGKLLMFFGSPGSNPDNINLPADIEINYEDAKLFQHYAHPDFKLEYIILVSSQFGVNKVNIFGYGRMKDMEYPDDTATDKP